MEQNVSFVKTANLKIFEFFNQTFGKPVFDKIILFIHYLFKDLNYFIFYWIFFLAVTLYILYSKRNDKTFFQKKVLDNFSCILTFLVASLSLLLVIIIKNYADVHRPFCSNNNFYALKEIIHDLKCSQSFPSGHMAFSTLFVASFWTVFNRFFKTLSILLLLIVAISRMATAAHYPIDLLGAIFLVFPFTFYVRHKMTGFVMQLEQKKQISERLWKILCLQ